MSEGNSAKVTLRILVLTVSTPPITPKRFWGVSQRNLQEKLHLLVLCFSEKNCRRWIRRRWICVFGAPRFSVQRPQTPWSDLGQKSGAPHKRRSNDDGYPIPDCQGEIIDPPPPYPFLARRDYSGQRGGGCIL